MPLDGALINPEPHSQFVAGTPSESPLISPVSLAGSSLRRTRLGAVVEGDLSPTQRRGARIGGDTNDMATSENREQPV